MQAIRSKNTKIELKVGKALWQKGYRYRKNNKLVYGTPDFTFKKYKLAIFCDSVFWHGKNWDVLNRRIKTNRDFWVKKIEGNMARDKKVNWVLQKNGWVVLRFWEDEIEKNILSVIAQIEVAIISLEYLHKELKNATLQHRQLSNIVLLNKYFRYTTEEELIQHMPHLFE